MSNVDDYEARVAKGAAEKRGEQRAKTQSGEVVRQAAVAHIRLGKRQVRPGDVDEESDGAGSSHSHRRPSYRAKDTNERVMILEESRKERSKVFPDFLEEQHLNQKLRLDFEREERERDRIERERER
ncbi:hypothetical protein GN244_ATG15235 [Phytophthora infestans]|nr:hypothetical protein GN244_ATG15235 [Phytophthora infestans]